jgi:hypothetical protein
MDDHRHSPASEGLFKLAAFGFPNLDNDPSRGWANGYFSPGSWVSSGRPPGPSSLGSIDPTDLRPK